MADLLKEALVELMDACEALFSAPDWEQTGILSVNNWSDGDKTEMINAMLRAKAAFAVSERTCRWKYRSEDDTYEGCRKDYLFGPHLAGDFQVCPFCGGKIELKE